MAADHWCLSLTWNDPRVSSVKVATVSIIDFLLRTPGECLGGIKKLQSYGGQCMTKSRSTQDDQIETSVSLCS